MWLIFGEGVCYEGGAGGPGWLVGEGYEGEEWMVVGIGEVALGLMGCSGMLWRYAISQVSTPFVSGFLCLSTLDCDR